MLWSIIVSNMILLMTRSLTWFVQFHLALTLKILIRNLFVPENILTHPQGPVFRKPISTNPGLNFNLDFYTSLFDSLFGIIFSTLYGASNHQIVDKKNSTEFSLKASRAEIRFHTNPGLSKPSFEQPSPGPLVVILGSGGLSHLATNAHSS